MLGLLSGRDKKQRVGQFCQRLLKPDLSVFDDKLCQLCLIVPISLNLTQSSSGHSGNSHCIPCIGALGDGALSLMLMMDGVSVIKMY